MPDPLFERTVHAVSVDGAELVRYDTAGKWFIEHPPRRLISRRHVTVGTAAETAVSWQTSGGTIHRNRYGGTRFNSAVRRVEADRAQGGRR